MGVSVIENSNTIENLIIIGSGPAGYTTAIYAARANLNPLLITGFNKGGIPGGQLMTTTFVENYPGFPNGVMGPDLMDLFKEQAVRWGTRLLEDDVIEVNFHQRPFEIKVSNLSLKSHSVVIATGASANRLNLPNENKFWSKGISACAICDGATPQFKNEELAVVGGGDSACEEAVYLTKYGSKVHLIVRSNTLRASAAMADRVLNNSMVRVHFDSNVKNVFGDEWLDKLVIENSKNKLSEINVKGLFYAIGHTPNTELFINQVEINENGYLKTNEGRPETSVEGIFAAGDVADSEWRQGITAAGSGCMAALASERWLSKNNLSSIIKREDIDPKIIQKNKEIEISNEINFKIDAQWQKGSYALRKLYHESKKPLLVIYTSSNCGPCHVLKPQLKRVIQELEGQAQAVEIDIETDSDIAVQASVNGTPTIHLFHLKELKKQWKGVKQRKEFKEEISKLLNF